MNKGNGNKSPRILMLLENESYPEDCRVLLEAESLVDAGYELTVICPTDKSTKNYEQVGDVHVYRYPKPWELDGFVGYVYEYAYSMIMLFVWSLYVFFRRGFDAVHVHTPPDMTGVIAIFYKLLFRKRFVFDHHDLSPELYEAQRDGEGNALVTRVLLWFERLSCQWADRLIATNETQRSIQVERCGATRENCYIVRNGPNELFLNPEQFDSNQDLSTKVIGYVGVIGVQDGVDYLIRALHELRFKLERHDFRAVIVGGGTSLGTIKALTQELGLADRIEFTGMIPFEDVPEQIAAFDICATPDPSNPYNDSCTTIKTMEYMALGKPTVCFETLENQRTAGDCAVYAKNNCIASFAKAIETLMDDPEQCEKMGERSQVRIREGLTWEHQAEQLVLLYDGLFERQHESTTEDVAPKSDPAEDLELVAR